MKDMDIIQSIVKCRYLTFKNRSCLNKQKLKNKKILKWFIIDYQFF